MEIDSYPLFKFSLTLFFIFGGFGYMQVYPKDTINKVPGNKNLKQWNKIFRRVRGYNLYQTFFLVLVMVMVPVLSYFASREYQRNLNSIGSTFALSFLLNDALKLILVVFILICVRSKQKSLFTIMEDTYQMKLQQTASDVDTSSRNFAYTLFFLYIFGNLGCIGLTTYKYTTIVEIDIFVAKLVNQMLIIMLQLAFCTLMWPLVVLLSEPYKLMIKELNEIEVSLKGSSFKDQHSEEVDKRHSTVDTIPELPVRMEDEQIAHFNPEKIVEISRLYSAILRTFEIRQRALSYCGPAFVLLFLYTICTVILSLFYLSYVLEIQYVDQFLSCCQLVTSVSYTVFLLHLPHKIKYHVSDKLCMGNYCT